MLREIDPGANGNVSQTVKENGKTLTFGSQPFRWVELFAAQGQYLVDFIVEDLGANQYPVCTNISVR